MFINEQAITKLCEENPGLGRLQAYRMVQTREMLERKTPRQIVEMQRALVRQQTPART